MGRNEIFNIALKRKDYNIKFAIIAVFTVLFLKNK